MNNKTLIKDDLHRWSNTDNTQLYENLPLEEFYKIAFSGGLDTGKDIQMLMKYINSAGSILELGAGYGRILNHLITRGYKGKLTAIERSEKLVQWLQSQYQHCATIQHGSIMELNSKEKYDLILWMWAGLAEFSKPEQMAVFEILAPCLTLHGKIIFDMIPHDKTAPNAIEVQPQEQIIKTNYGTDHCYVPSEEEIHFYAEHAHLKIAEKIPYQTLPNRTRWLYVLSSE